MLCTRRRFLHLGVQVNVPGDGNTNSVSMSSAGIKGFGAAAEVQSPHPSHFCFTFHHRDLSNLRTRMTPMESAPHQQRMCCAATTNTATTPSTMLPPPCLPQERERERDQQFPPPHRRKLSLHVQHRSPPPPCLRLRMQIGAAKIKDSPRIMVNSIQSEVPGGPCGVNVAPGGTTQDGVSIFPRRMTQDDVCMFPRRLKSINSPM